MVPAVEIIQLKQEKVNQSKVIKTITKQIANKQYLYVFHVPQLLQPISFLSGRRGCLVHFSL
jgi:hypothetical protein